MLKAKDCNRIFDTFHEMCMLNCLGMYWNAKLGTGHIEFNRNSWPLTAKTVKYAFMRILTGVVTI